MPDKVPSVTPTDIEDGQPKKGRRFDARDFQTVADYVHEEAFRRRQDADRRHLEKVWREIDRQIRMEPDIRRKLDATGKPLAGAAWRAELELPLQAQTLEVLTADARKLMFPDSGLWFGAHAQLSDDYLKRVDFTSLVAGDETEVPSQINQDNADRLTEGWLDHYHNQYDFRGTWDKLNAEAFKYGTLIGRARIVTKSLFIDTAQGVVKRDQKIPVLFAQSVKNVLLDKSQHHLLNEGLLVGPAPIRCITIKLVDLQMQAAKGGTDPDDMDGGWMPSNAQKLIDDGTGHVELLEYEGDLIVPRKTTRSMFLPNVIATVAVGGNGPKCVRFRFNQYQMGTYLIGTYHVEGADDVYGVSPLMKGMPIQKAAVEMLNQIVDWGELNVQPPIEYSKDDPFFAQTGGPEVSPRALWASVGGAKPVQIGEGEPIQSAYAMLLKQYDDVTGVNAPRLGAQVVSHTTAYAKQIETQKGQARTVDYVDTTLTGPATRWLQMEMELGKIAMGSREETFFIEAYGGWVTLTKDKLPDDVVFDAFGAAEPIEQQQKRQLKMAAASTVVQLEGTARQLGFPPSLNLPALQKEIMREGGWTDIDPFFTSAPGGVQTGTPGAPAVPGPALGIGAASNTALARLTG